MKVNDLKTMAAGAAAWAIAVPAVRFAGSACTSSEANRYAAVVAGVGIAYATTPLLSKLMKWKTPSEKVRGIALALGTAQVIDGLLHIFVPSFYSDHADTKVACAGNVFLGAGLLGLFSAFQ